MALIPDFATRVISFADFQVDLRAGELRHNGAKIKLQNQPLQVLTMLLEHPGEIVTRDEMRARLWPAETFVDFDHGLNSAVRRLRDALGDSADKPVYIETVGRRGYRFVFPVERNNGNSNNGKDGGYLAPKPPISSAPSKPIPYAPTLGSTRSLDWKSRLLIAAGVFLVVGSGLFFTNGNHIGQSSLGQWLRQIAPGSRSESPMVTQRQLTANPQDVPVTSAALSPDGKYLTYTDKTGVYVRQISTGETHPIQLPEGFHPLVQSWFPDGAHVAVSYVGVDGKPPSLWVLSILGGSPRHIAEDGAAARVSPDGSQVFFLRSAIGRNEVWLMQADGDRQRRILSDSSADQVYFSPMAWAPDGRRAAFIRTVVPVYNAADPTGAKKTLEVLDLPSGRVEVAVDGLELEGAFGWAGEDSLLYSLRELPPAQNDFSLWRVPIAPHASQPRSPAVKLATGYGWAADLSVSNNDRSLALRRVEPNADAYIADVDSNTKHLAPKRLTLDDRADYVFGWTADSNSILFLSDREGALHLYRQAVNQTQPELLVGGNAILAIPRISPSGTDVFYLQMPKHGDSSDHVKIMHVPLAGGVPQPILEAPGIWNYQCARLPARLCIYSPTDANVQKFFAFDPNTGLSHEITSARMSADPERPNWSLSPDGSILASRVLRSDSDAAVRLLSLNGRSQTMIPLPGWPRMAGIDWASDGKSLWIAASDSRTGGPRNCALLNVSTHGAIRVMVQDENLCLLAGIPSPDGRHLALEGVRPDSSNVWLLENF